MLRRYLQLSAYMIHAQLFYKRVIRICHYVVKTDSGTYKYFFDFREFSETSQKLQIVFMIHFQVFARRREKALPMFTCPMCELFFAGRISEICGRTSYIMNISFKNQVPPSAVLLLQSMIHDFLSEYTPLMKGQCTETAGSKTSAITDQTEFHFGNCGIAPCWLSYIG